MKSRADAMRALSELVTMGDITASLGVSRQTVWNWKYRYGSFPKPVGRLAVGDIYWWPEVEMWLERTGRAS